MCAHHFGVLTRSEPQQRRRPSSSHRLHHNLQTASRGERSSLHAAPASRRRHFRPRQRHRPHSQRPPSGAQRCPVCDAPQNGVRIIKHGLGIILGLGARPRLGAESGCGIGGPQQQGVVVFCCWWLHSLLAQAPTGSGGNWPNFGADSTLDWGVDVLALKAELHAWVCY